MPKRWAQILVQIFFVLLLATPVVLHRLNLDGAGTAGGAYRGEAQGGQAAAASAMDRYGFYLQEVAHAAGVDFKHRAPQLDASLEHIMPQVASMGAGVAVADFDRDGWQDFYATNSGEGSFNSLYRNLGNGTFEDVAAKLGVADVNRQGTGVSMGAVWGDVDNDGWEDLFIYKWGRPELFRNEGGKKFTRITEKANFPHWLNANTAVWLDYDCDGKLDLFIGGYYPEDVNLWNLKTTRIMPDSFEYAQNGGRKYLLRNTGQGVFEDVTTRTGVNSRRWALAALASDLNSDGYPDIFIANDYGVSELFINQGGRHFREVGKQALYWNKAKNIGPKSGMNAAAGDILNDGKQAVYVSNISEAGVLIQGNNLWVPQAGRSTPGDVPRYDNLAGDMGVELGGWSFGAQFGDLNNDGLLDLYLTNGYVSADKNKSYWYDFSKIAGGNSVIIADAKYWPPMKGTSLSGYQNKHLWLNDGAGRFRDVAQTVGVTDQYDGRAVALADLGNRGALDIITAGQRAPLLLYRNQVAPAQQWIQFELEGTRSNRSAIGARVLLLWNNQRQLQEVSGGSGFCSQNQRRLHFGLGENARIDRAIIRWPSGIVQTLTAPQPGKLHHIKEPAKASTAARKETM